MQRYLEKIIQNRGAISWFMIAFVIWSLYLLSFWPGLMTPDSIFDWQQAHTMNINDAHSPVHILYLRMVTFLWDNPAVVSFSQIFLLSLFTALFYSTCSRYTPRWLLNAVLGFFVLSPVNGTMVISIWQDVPYSIFVSITLLITLKLALSDGAWLHNTPNQILTVIILCVVAVWRHNGIATAIGCCLILPFFLPNIRRIMFKLGVLLVLSICLIEGPLYGLLGIQRLTWFKLTPFIHQIAAHVAAGTPLTPQEADFLSAIGTISPKNYNPFCVNPLIYNKNKPPNIELLERSPGRLIRLWFDLTVRNPYVTLKHLFYSSSLIWSPLPLRGSYLAITYVGYDYSKNTVYGGVEPNNLGLKSETKLPGLQTLIAKVVQRTITSPYLLALVWAPATYFYLTIASLLFSIATNRNLRPFLIFSPMFSHTLPLLLVNIAQDFRYQYPCYIIGVLSSVMAAIRKPSNRPG